MKRFKDILCVVDAGEECAPALERAVSLAENNRASLAVAGVVQRVDASILVAEGGPGIARLQDAMESALDQGLETLVEPYRTRTEIQTLVLRGTPFLEIVREVLRNDRDLVIKLPQTPDWLDRLFGSDDMHLLRKCPCPVWLIKPRAPAARRRILAAVDVEEAHPPGEQASRQALNQQILEMAGSLALSEFAELHIVHAWEAVGEGFMRGAMMSTPEAQVTAYVDRVRRLHEKGLDGLIQRLRSQLGPDTMDYLEPRIHLVKGWASKEIPALARRIEATLVVMGTVARTGVPGLIMGNTAETILNQIDCSVLAVKPPGFVTPVTVEE